VQTMHKRVLHRNVRYPNIVVSMLLFARVSSTKQA